VGASGAIGARPVRWSASTHDGPGWRWIFLINIPIGLAILCSADPAREGSSWQENALSTWRVR